MVIAKKVTKAKIKKAINDWFYNINVAGHLYNINVLGIPRKGRSGFVSGGVAIEFVHTMSKDTQQFILEDMKYVLVSLGFKVNWAEFLKFDNTIYITFV